MADQVPPARCIFDKYLLNIMSTPEPLERHNFADLALRLLACVTDRQYRDDGGPV